MAREDIAPFALGRLPDDAKGRSKAEDLAARLHEMLAGRTTMTYGEAGYRIGVHGNQLRYAATTGTVLIRWAGARAPTIRTVPRPPIEPFEARLELARRYLHAYGPMTPAAFASWAGIGPAQGRAAFQALGPEVMEVRSPIGDGWILRADEGGFRAPPGPTAPARLLPSGDAYFLLWGADRELLVPEADRRGELWTPRVWPGAVLAGRDVVGTWRRDQHNVSVRAWRPLTASERAAIEAEASSLPLPELKSDIRVRWDG